MSSAVPTLSTGFNSVASNTKLEAWNQNKNKNLRDTILKIVAIVALILLGWGALAAVIVVPALLPTLPVAAVLTLAIPAPLFYVFSNFAGMILGLMTDWTNYRNPDQVVKTLSHLKRAKAPYPVSTYKRLHRYGIISKHELGRRKALEGSCSEYKQVVSELNNISRLIVSKDNEIARLALMPSMVAPKSKLEAEVATLKDRADELDRQKIDLEREFKRFHVSIVSFDPTA